MPFVRLHMLLSLSPVTAEHHFSIFVQLTFVGTALGPSPAHSILLQLTLTSVGTALAPMRHVLLASITLEVSTSIHGIGEKHKQNNNKTQTQKQQHEFPPG
jgi:hypothetical protein